MSPIKILMIIIILKNFFVIQADDEKFCNVFAVIKKSVVMTFGGYTAYQCYNTLLKKEKAEYLEQKKSMDTHVLKKNQTLYDLLLSRNLECDNIKTEIYQKDVKGLKSSLILQKRQEFQQINHLNAIKNFDIDYNL